MKSIKRILFSVGSLLLICATQSVSACGFYETESDYRAMMFRAKLPQMASMQPFSYTMSAIWGGELNSDPNEVDRLRNCNEWRTQCDVRVTVDDIYQLLYKTDGEICMAHFEKKSINKSLSHNSFAIFLSKKQNKPLLDYVLFAKAVEMQQQLTNSRFENWNEDYEAAQLEAEKNAKLETLNKKQLLELANKRITDVKSEFVKQRYAFQLCRLSFELNAKPTAAEIYDRYFGHIQANNLMSVWSCLYKAHALSGRESNRCLIQVFNNCDEKKFRCVQLFADSFIPTKMTAAENSTCQVILALKNPARVLPLIKNAYRLNAGNQQIPFLILREINKLEDWLITPQLYGKYSITNDDPFKKAYVDPYQSDRYIGGWDSYGQSCRSKNRATDLNYLAQLKQFIIMLHQQSTGDIHDFYTISLAHIALLQENATEAADYLSKIPANALPTIRLQQKLETCWLAIKTKDVNSCCFEKTFLENIQDIERIKSPGIENHQMLYTLTLALANEYFRKGNVVYGNLMRLKSDFYRENYTEDYWTYISDVSTYSNKIVYFNKNATIADMDKLIGLVKSKNKSKFERYLCDKTTTSIDWYNDLKGTIAFRNNDLELAYKTFEKIPTEFWHNEKNYFKDNLNENPFIPKGLQKSSLRKFNYKFSKLEFVKSLMELRKKAETDKNHAADYYNQLGNAFFNTSYWGNAWMMMRYSWSCVDTDYSNTRFLPPWMKDYMLALRAQTYYKQAYKCATNNEQRAYAAVMLHYINRTNLSYQKSKSDKQQADYYGNIFKKHRYTNTFRMYDCPGIEKYLKP